MTRPFYSWRCIALAGIVPWLCLCLAIKRVAGGEVPPVVIPRLIAPGQASLDERAFAILPDFPLSVPLPKHELILEAIKQPGLVSRDSPHAISIRLARMLLQEKDPREVFSGPELSARDVVNAADHKRGPVAPGEIVIVFPSNAGPPEMVPWGLNGNLERTTLIGETRVLFDDIAAIVIYSVRGQVGTIVPEEVAGKQTTEMVVEYQGKRSPPVTLAVVDSAPALFTLNALGKGQVAMLNETGCCNSVRNPALRGTVASLYATGEGRIPPGRIARNVSVTVGGVPARILYTGKVGSLQVNFRVPVNAPVGDTVPLVLTVGNRQSSPDVTMAVRSARRRVLVVDSDVVNRDRLARILERAGYELCTAPDGPVFEATAQEPPDLLIMDLATPEQQTLELVRTLRQAQPQLKIIAMSPVFSPDTLRTADILGAHAVLTKPLNVRKVLARVRSVLQKRPAVY